MSDPHPLFFYTLETGSISVVGGCFAILQGDISHKTQSRMFNIDEHDDLPIHFSEYSYLLNSFEAYLGLRNVFTHFSQ